MYAKRFKQLDFQSSVCGFESRHPYQQAIGCSSMVERRIVDAKMTSSILASRSKLSRGALGEHGSSRLSLNQESDGSNPSRAINFQGAVAER
jgi:hypothetical protein